MRTQHYLVDGTILNSVEDILIPRNKETQGYYKMLKKILTERGYQTSHGFKDSSNDI